MDNEFKPTITQDGYALMKIAISNCHKCDRTMIESPKPYYYNPFPTQYNKDFDYQIRSVGWVKRSNIIVDDLYICVECAEKGLADFVCALCFKRYPSDKEKESFGYPPEYLCENCYKTVPAEKWDNEREELMENHRWDCE